MRAGVRAARAAGGALLVCAHACVFGSAKLGAQAAPETLTLEEALSLAAQHNPAYQQAANDGSLAGPQARQAWGAFLPDLSVSFNTGQSFRREKTAVDFFGQPIENPITSIVSSSSSSQGLSMSFGILEGGRRFHDVALARAQAAVSTKTAESRLNTVLAEVHREYLAAQRQQSRLMVEEELLAAREQDVELARQRYELAAIGRSDLLGAQLDLRSQQLLVARGRAELDGAILNLRAAIGDPGLGAFAVEQEQPELFDPALLDIEALVQSALESAPRILAAQAATRQQQAVVRQATSGRLPTIRISAGASRSQYGKDRSAIFAFNPDDFNGYASLSVSVPVFDGFRTSYQIAQARVALRNAGEQIREAELDIERQIRLRHLQLATIWEDVREKRLRLEIAAERLEIVQEEYRLAVKSVEDLRAAVREHSAALRDEADQRYEFALGLLQLYEVAERIGEGGAREALPRTSPES